jgi:chromosome segregation ATPase
VRNDQVDSRFWIVSAVVHGAIFLIFFISPAGQRIFRPEAKALKPEIIKRDEELAEVIDQIRDLAVDRLQSQLTLLRAGQDRMATNFETMNAHYRPFVAGQLETVQARLNQEASAVFAKQDELLAGIERAVNEKEAGADPMWRAYDKNRASILAGQEEIRRALLLAAADQAELVDLEERVDINQMEVFSLLTSSVTAQNTLWGDANRSTQLTEGLARMRTSLTELDTASSVSEREVSLARERQMKAESEIKQLTDSGVPDPKKLEAATKEIKRAKAQIEIVERRLERRKAQREQLAQKLLKQEMESRTIAERPQELASRRDALALQARDLQRQVNADQRLLYDGLVQFLKSRAGNENAPAPAATKPAGGLP